MLFLGLALAQELLFAPLPDVIQTQITAKPHIQDQVTQIKNILLYQEKTNQTSIRFNRIYFQVLDNPKDKIWSFLDAIVTPTPLEWQIITLPRFLLFLYYPLRLFRLLFKYFRFH